MKAAPQWSLELLSCILLALLAVASGCSSPAPTHQPGESQGPGRLLGFSVQVGAFTNLENAVRLESSLQRYTPDAYYFRARDGLYRVRFGDFVTEELARREAMGLRATGVIGEHFIVKPQDYAVYRKGIQGSHYLRDEIVRTAKGFLDVPYRWGGTSGAAGFDCSGLAMAVYKYNGLRIPRSSVAQFSSGVPVRRESLARGDLVFFATGTRARVSHVGIYIGREEFIHAPGQGDAIRIDSLRTGYYAKRYLGARNYID